MPEAVPFPHQIDVSLPTKNQHKKDKCLKLSQGQVQDISTWESEDYRMSMFAAAALAMAYLPK